MKATRATTTDRFWAKVDKSGACWLWTASTNRSGYGTFWDGERKVLAHRWAYGSVRGTIPDGLTLDHLCRVRHCVNPAHLEPVTVGENTRRGMSPTATVVRSGRCARGHEMSPENTYRRRDGKRDCVTCRKESEGRKAYQRQYQRKRRQDPAYLARQREAMRDLRRQQSATP